MKESFLLEIAVESARMAQAAERGGADRIELCLDLRNGGITPSAGVMQETRAAVRLPVHAIIRPRAGDFVYRPEELSQLERSIVMARELKMDGVVLGMLNEKKAVDVQGTKRLIDLAVPMPVTFHRAFDECGNLHQALEEVIATGANRILTSGGAATASEGANALESLVRKAGQRIVVMPGGGINPGNFKFLREMTGAKEFHSGLGTTIAYGGQDCLAFEAEVRKLKSAAV